MLQLSFSSVLTRRHLTHNGSRIRNSCCAMRALEGRRSRHARVLLLCSSSKHAARLSAHLLRLPPAAVLSSVWPLLSCVVRTRRAAAPRPCEGAAPQSKPQPSSVSFLKALPKSCWGGVRVRDGLRLKGEG